MASSGYNVTLNTLRPRQNGRHFADDTIKRIFLNQNVRNSIKISLKFVPKGRIHNIPSLVQIMAWRRPSYKPLSEPMMVRLPTHICVIRTQWVKLPIRWVFVLSPWILQKYLQGYWITFIINRCHKELSLNSMRHRQNGHHFVVSVSKVISMYENNWILSQVSL